MTYCTTLAKPLLKKIKAGKTLDEIGAELCGNSVKNPRQKAVRLIRELLGEETLSQYADILKYDVEKAELSRKRKSPPQRKTSTTTDSESKRKKYTIINVECAPLSGFDTEQAQQPASEPHEVLVSEVRELVKRFGFEKIVKVLEVIKQELIKQEDYGK